MLSKNAIGNLINRYKAVLKKCHLLNTFGKLAMAAAISGALMVGGAGTVGAASFELNFSTTGDQVLTLTGDETITTVTTAGGNYNLRKR